MRLLLLHQSPEGKWPEEFKRRCNKIMQRVSRESIKSGNFIVNLTQCFRFGYLAFMPRLNRIRYQTEWHIRLALLPNCTAVSNDFIKGLDPKDIFESSMSQPVCLGTSNLSPNTINLFAYNIHMPWNYLRRRYYTSSSIRRIWRGQHRMLIFLCFQISYIPQISGSTITWWM